jgi:hypothetical protein
MATLQNGLETNECVWRGHVRSTLYMATQMHFLLFQNLRERGHGTRMGRHKWALHPLEFVITCLSFVILAFNAIVKPCDLTSL